MAALSTITVERNGVTEESSRCEDPGFQVSMYPHQLAIARKMLDMEQSKKVIARTETGVTHINTNIGFLTDQLGAGKTLSVLCAIANGKKEPIEQVDVHQSIHAIGSVSENRVFCDVTHVVDVTERYVDTTLIVMPQYLLSTVWREEILKTDLRAAEGSEFHVFTIDELNELDVILCSIEEYQPFLMRHDYSWRRVVVDEADSGRITNFVEPTTNFMWFVSNSMKQTLARYYRNGLMSRLHIMPEWVFQLLEVYTTPSFYSSSVDIIPFNTVLPDLIPLKISALTKNVAPQVVQEHIENSNFAKALKGLGGIRSDNILLQLHMDIALGIDRYRDTVSRLGFNGYMDRLTILRENVIAIGVFHCVCCSVESSTPPVIFGGCHHSVCQECGVLALHEEHCPICNIEVFKQSTVTFDEDNDPIACVELYTRGYQTIADSGKSLVHGDPRIRYILQQIRMPENERNIVFSSPSSRKVIYKALKEARVNPRMLTPGRMQCLIKLEEGDIRVVCADGSTTSHGLNLPYVDSIFIFDELSTENLRQAIGRGQRMGRSKPLNVHILTH